MLSLDAKSTIRKLMLRSMGLKECTQITNVDVKFVQQLSKQGQKFTNKGIKKRYGRVAKWPKASLFESDISWVQILPRLPIILNSRKEYNGDCYVFPSMSRDL